MGGLCASNGACSNMRGNREGDIWHEAHRSRHRRHERHRKATVERFLEAGDEVWYLGRHEKPEVAELFRTKGEAHFIKADVSDEEACHKAVAEVLDAAGRIDVLVNVAGIVGARESFLEIPMEEVRKVLASNLMGTMYMGQTAAQVMVERRSGVIVNVGSICGHMANTESVAYHASKGAVTMLTKAEARELAPYGIRAVEVAPGWVHTGMVDEATLAFGGRLHMDGSIVEPEEVASLIYLASLPEAAALCGTTIMADKGYSAFKGLDGYRAEQPCTHALPL